MVIPQKNVATDVLTIGLEDYFQVGAFDRLIPRRRWDRFESRLERNTRCTLALLEPYEIRATFFVLGWIAERMPELVRDIAQRGHEIANRGYDHRCVRGMSRGAFREDLQRSHEALERASGTRVLGYRVGRQPFTSREFWALEILAQEGYVYDSSVVPRYWAGCGLARQRHVGYHRLGAQVLWEFPFATWHGLGWPLPIAGGNYFRQLPHTLVKRAVAAWHRRYDAPFVMYFHVWELDAQQPRIAGASRLSRLRHYRNLDKMTWVLKDYFQHYRFGSIADYLGLDRRLAGGAEDAGHQAPAPARPVRLGSPGAALGDVPAGVPVSVVVPCFNEAPVLPYLARTLQQVEAALAPAYTLRFLFVDDGSTDATWSCLQALFGDRANCEVLRHEVNLGIAAGIMTGLRHATTDIVASIDCDCSYDPGDLQKLLPLLTDGVAMVTASPYHPQGDVMNVPLWRLALSKAASRLYRGVLRQKLYTYTSCFRVYRREAVQDMALQQAGFLGIVEMLGHLDQRGETLVECPVRLESRVLGQSKMKVAVTALAHLNLLARLLAHRLLSAYTRMMQS
ncbi:MAG: hypothetical protein ETSY1_04915 [Candidatus Entotheonella factor]|uniref:NodB homology domain-containing protein n=1 Tax=Entotheonella factor TaxID=1429438 RepID=W4LWD0_ENTF1|nr:MAG: hypothetical protein ETSY1_04915 [Candidatus Entotheonella factor]